MTEQSKPMNNEEIARGILAHCPIPDAIRESLKLNIIDALDAKDAEIERLRKLVKTGGIDWTKDYVTELQEKLAQYQTVLEKVNTILLKTAAHFNGLCKCTEGEWCGVGNEVKEALHLLNGLGEKKIE